MTTQQFNESVNADIRRMTNKAKSTAAWIETPSACYLVGKPNKAIQVCNAGDWPDHLPESFGEWLASNNDSIEITMPLDRTEATCQWFDNKAKTERSPFA